MSIPISEIDGFVAEYNIKLYDFKEINCKSWSYLLKEKEGIPQYFGLVALQCLAAFKMQNQNGITAANFKVRFAGLIGVIDANELNSFFSEDFDFEFKVQEKIWLSARAFFKNKSIKIILPEITRYAGRFTQFPKSQIVLNHEDLKEYSSFFTVINNGFESISFEDFKKYYLNEISNFRNNFRRENNTKNDNQWSEIELKIKLKQIFDFYCSDDWMIKNEILSFNNSISNENYIIKFSPSELLLYDEYYNILDSLNSLVRNKRFMIFKENKNYPNEFESVNSISLNDNNILLIYQSAANQKEIRASNSVFLPLDYENQKHNVLIFKIKNSDNLPDFLKNKVISDYPIELKGFKVSGEKKYFVNNPPKIHLKEDIRYNIYYNKKIIDINEMNRVGKYTIRINGYSNYNFELVELPLLNYPINDKTNSLEFSSLDYKNEETGCISGLLLKYKDNVMIETLTIKNWIKTINGIRINSDSQLFKAIENSRNGKY
ncbi:hypothetical protein [Flavobacterium praedii]|uniref:hypothetical protein n=1 Tax=Flavobacterium praedii TaxID=3002900 RepID=UPI002481D5E3|nr:hypothetical protein [Flavobacterium praedii]